MRALSPIVVLFLVILSYFIINRNYYVKEWLYLKPIHDHASKFFCSKFINCTDVSLLFRHEDDLVFSKKISVVSAYIYYKAFAHSAGERNRKPVWLISHWDHVLESRNDIIYVFIDGEPDSLCYFDDKASNMLYIGHKVTHSNIVPAKSIFLPYFVTSFIERDISPLYLTQKGHFDQKKKYFGAYIASNCVPLRERAFDLFYEFAKENNLGEVHSMGACYGSYQDSQRRFANDSRTSADFLISAVNMLQEYKYVITFENTYQKGYITEKINSPFLANAIPIYFGSDVILDFINPNSFFYIRSIEDLKELLTVENFSESKRKEMVEMPKLLESAYYYFSIYDDFAEFLRKNNSRTILDDISDMVKQWT